MAIKTVLEDVVATLRDRFGEEPDGLRPPASEANLAELRESVGVAMPELEALLRLHDGEDEAASTFLLGGASWLLPAAEIAGEYRELCDLARRSGRLDVVDAERVSTVGPVKPCHWNTRWIPFWRFGSPWAIDLDPRPGGKSGQVIAVVWDNLEARVEFESIEAMLASYLRVLKDGERRFAAAMVV